MKTRVVGLYIHGPRSSREGDAEPTPMLPVTSVHAVEAMGLQEDSRYFRRPDDEQERKRQVSLIDEATIWRHEKWFGPIDRPLVKAQIVLEGDFFLPDRIGEILRFESGAQLTLSLHRRPCFAMDLISPGLREAMEGRQQGALARVTVSGLIKLNDGVQLLDEREASHVPGEVLKVSRI